MPARKRVIEEVDAPESPPAAAPADPLLFKIRNMWEFACLMQYIYLFGEVVKISKDVDVDTLEMECCNPTPSNLLPQIGLALLKFVSSHRGLTPDLFDEYTRRQYDSKAPHKPNPFGYDEEPRKFTDFDIVLKLRVLHQLSVWTLNNPDRIRQALADDDMTNWRIEPFGWDHQDRVYYILDDNRLYRRTEPVVQAPRQNPPKPKPQPKKQPPPLPPKPKGSRSSKRQRLANGLANDSDAEHDVTTHAEPASSPPSAENESSEPDPDNGLGGSKWECVAITFQEYKDFTDSFKRSKDPNEKELRQRLIEDIFPVLEKLAADHERKAAQKRREWENIQRLASAKRSSRIADKHEKEKEQREIEEAERKRQEELAMAKKELERQRKIEEAREARMITREQRLRDREMRRILSEQQLAELESQSQDGSENAQSRASERRRQHEIERQRRQVEEIAKDEEEWDFDCSICGVHGKNLDDGTHIIACEKCDVWQHSACHGINVEDADREDFHFLCSSCQNPRPLKLNIANTAEAQDQPARPPKSKRGRKPKAATELVDETKTKRKRDPDAPSSERKKRQKKQQDVSAAQTNGTGPNSHRQYSHGSSAHAQSDSRAAHASPLHRPTQGHFLPPSASQGARPNGHVFYNYNPSNYPTYHAPNGQPLYPEPAPPFPETQANGDRPITAFDSRFPNHTRPAHSPVHGMNSPSSQPLHNPYLNDFARQRGPSHPNESHSFQTPSLSKPQTSHSPPSANFATSRAHLPPTDRDRPSPNVPSIAASPTPSLSATQGNTSVRFSPSQPHSSHQSVSYTPANHVANSYAPTTHTPAVSAISPMKQSSSPPLPLPQPSQSQAQSTEGKPQIPKFHSPTQPSTAGISPIKQDVPASLSQPLGSPGLGITISNNASVPHAPAQSPSTPHAARDSEISANPQPSKAPSSMQHILNQADAAHAHAPKPMTLPPAPTLSPSFGINKTTEPLPKKIDASPPLPPIDAPVPNQSHPPFLPDPATHANPTTDNVTLPPIASALKPSPEPTKSP